MSRILLEFNEKVNTLTIAKGKRWLIVDVDNKLRIVFNSVKNVRSENELLSVLTPEQLVNLEQKLQGEKK